MNDLTLKAIVFGILIVIVYAIHQWTVGGDGVVVAGVLTALGAVGGYALGRRADGRS